MHADRGTVVLASKGAFHQMRPISFVVWRVLHVERNLPIHMWGISIKRGRACKKMTVTQGGYIVDYLK
jgi:hypothetical protein